ncbi:MAG: hypothetical protein U0169_27105 [Polyangiaceae bacterium]
MKTLRAVSSAVPVSSLAGLVAAALFVPACASATSVETDVDSDVASREDAVTDVVQSTVKRQSIGNCWVYAASTWTESLNLSATNTELNTSESYVTYWHWFEQLTSGQVRGTEVPTGGWFQTATSLMNRYGVVAEADFIVEEATVIESRRQATALDVMNESLQNGVLKTAAARRDRALVRSELDRAFALAPTVKATLDRLFGTAVDRTLTSKDRFGRDLVATAGSFVRRTREIPVAFALRPGAPPTRTTLEYAISVWRASSYRSSDRRTMQKRIQRALHDKQPVVISWLVDFAALSTTGEFRAPPTEFGRQGGHVTVLEDYQVENVPGFGTLPAGVVETRPAALTAALSDRATVTFFRTKNSWGGTRPERFPTGFIGYNDLYLDYLNGPINWCQTRENGDPDGECLSSTPQTPLGDIVLPPNY